MKSRISTRLILLSFVLLTFLVIVNLLSSTSRLSVVLDMSVKMKSDMLSAISDAFLTSDANRTINGTFSLRTFQSRDSLMKDYEHWVEKHKSHVYRIDNSTKDRIQNTVNDINSSNATKPVSVNIFGNSGDAKTRQTTCDNCFMHDFSYVIQNENICKVSEGETIELLLLILTTHQNIRARSAIRETWVKPSGRNTKHIRYAFLLGETKDSKLRKLVQDENELHHDIIKEDFVDSYRNLTYKTIMGFKWASTMCAHARYVMKTDDDMWVNIPNLLRTLEKRGPLYMETRIIGACSKMAGPIRNPRSKWFASNESYPQKFYPGFCSGTGYVTSLNVAKEVYKISQNVPFFHLEDVYVALCINELNFTLSPTQGFNIGRPKVDPCLYKGNKLITSHQIAPFMLKMIWNTACRRGNNATLPKPNDLEKPINLTIKSPP